jgi:hypothetical protein
MRLDNNDKAYFQEIKNNDGSHHTSAVNLTMKTKVPPEDICNYMRHPTQFYKCKKTGQPLEESNLDLLTEAPLLDVLTKILGGKENIAQKILSEMKKKDVTNDVVKYLDHEAWLELGVKSAIQRCKIMEAVSNMSFEPSANKETETARQNEIESGGKRAKLEAFSREVKAKFASKKDDFWRTKGESEKQ